MAKETVLFDGVTGLGRYQVIDMVYEGRPARVLFSGNRSAAQSGIALDGKDELLFDYNNRFVELVASVQPRRMLLIGGGAFTLPMHLLQLMPALRIDVVELDPGLQAIAEGFFDLHETANLHITYADGRDFLAANTTPYDLILIDAFLGDVIPAAFSDASAAALLKRNLTDSGVVGMNIIAAYHGYRALPLTNIFAAYKRVFRHVSIFPADTALSEQRSQNFILVAQQNAGQYQLDLRFPEVTAAFTTKFD